MKIFNFQILEQGKPSLSDKLQKPTTILTHTTQTLGNETLITVSYQSKNVIDIRDWSSIKGGGGYTTGGGGKYSFTPTKQKKKGGGVEL